MFSDYLQSEAGSGAMFSDYLQSNPGSGAMFSYYLQATFGKNENENSLAFKGFKNSVNGIFGENGLDD